MSIESAKAFLEKVKNDEDFRNSVGEISTMEKRMEFVKTAGFDFTKEEIKSVHVELSDEDLGWIAGGKWQQMNGTLKIIKKAANQIPL